MSEFTRETDKATYLEVPLSVISYIQAYVGGQNNTPMGTWDGKLMLDSVVNRVTLCGCDMPMDLDYDWCEPYVNYLKKVRKILEETLVPVTTVMKEKQAVALQNLMVWTVEAELRKGCLGPWKYQD